MKLVTITGGNKQHVEETSMMVRQITEYLESKHALPYLWYEKDEGWTASSKPPTYYKGIDGEHWYCNEDWTSTAIKIVALPEPKHKTILATTESINDFVIPVELPNVLQ